MGDQLQNLFSSKSGDRSRKAPITDRLVIGTILACEMIKSNGYDLWNESTSKKEKVQFMPS